MKNDFNRNQNRIHKKQLPRLSFEPNPGNVLPRAQHALIDMDERNGHARLTTKNKATHVASGESQKLISATAYPPTHTETVNWLRNERMDEHIGKWDRKKWNSSTKLARQWREMSQVAIVLSVHRHFVADGGSSIRIPH